MMDGVSAGWSWTPAWYKRVVDGPGDGDVSAASLGGLTRRVYRHRGCFPAAWTTSQYGTQPQRSTYVGVNSN